MTQKTPCPRCGFLNRVNEVACLQCSFSLDENERREGVETQGAVGADLPAYGLPPKADFGAMEKPPVRRGQGLETASAAEIWNYREYLVCSRSISLPPFCVTCNRPATRRHSLPVSWYPKWVWFFFVIPVLGILVLLFNIQRDEIELGLCDAHWRIHRRSSVVGGVLVILGCGGLVYQLSTGPSATGLSLSLGGFLVGSILAVWSATFIFPRVHKMNRHYIWLSRTSAAFRERFPRAG
jgi:hypothetical protein